MWASPLNTKLTLPQDQELEPQNWEWKLRTETKTLGDTKKQIKDIGAKIHSFTQAKITYYMIEASITTFLLTIIHLQYYFVALGTYSNDLG